MMDIQNLKENLKILIDQLTQQLEIEYLEVVDNQNHESIFRYANLNNYLKIYKSLYDTETDEEFMELLKEYINISVDVLNEQLEESIEKEDYERCADLKTEIDLIRELYK